MYACNFSVYKIRWFIHLFLVCCLHQNGTSYSIIYIKFPFLLLKINIPRYSNIHVLPSLDFMVYNGVSLNWGALMHSLLFVLKLMINFFQFCTDMVAQVTISLMISNTLHLILCTAPSRSCGLSSGSCQTLQCLSTVPTKKLSHHPFSPGEEMNSERSVAGYVMTTDHLCQFNNLNSKFLTETWIFCVHVFKISFCWRVGKGLIWGSGVIWVKKKIHKWLRQFQKENELHMYLMCWTIVSRTEI